MSVPESESSVFRDSLKMHRPAFIFEKEVLKQTKVHICLSKKNFKKKKI